MRTRWAFVAFALVVTLSFGVSLAQAAPVTATHTVSGSPGNWVYDFTVNNNIGDSNSIYFWGVKLSSTDIQASPSPFAYAPRDNPWTTFGGTGTSYNDPWCVNACGEFGGPIFPPYGIGSGTSLGGFKAGDTGLTPLSGVQWFAYASGGNDPNPDGHFNDDGNPGFEGTSTGSVPEPSTLLLLSTGILGLFGYARRKR